MKIVSLLLELCACAAADVPKWCTDNNKNCIPFSSSYEVRTYEAARWVSYSDEVVGSESVDDVLLRIKKKLKAYLAGANSENRVVGYNFPILIYTEDNKKFTNYVQPSSSDQSNLPTPTDSSVSILNFPGRSVFVWGLPGRDNLEQQKTEFVIAIGDASLYEPTGSLALYRSENNVYYELWLFKKPA